MIHMECLLLLPIAVTITGLINFPKSLYLLFINNIRHGKALPVYGKGENVRDWLYVVESCTCY